MISATSGSEPPTTPQPLRAPDGYLLDGHSPQRQPVLIAVKPDGLRYTTSARIAASWDFAAIDWSQSQCSDTQFRLCRHGNSDAWLVITAPQTVWATKTAHRQWAGQNFWLARLEAWNTLKIIGSTLLVLGLLWLAWPYAADRLAPHVPQVWRERLSDTTQDEITFGKPACQTAAGAQAVAVMQARLSVAQPALSQVKILIVHSPLVNAMTLPDGRVIVTDALLGKAQNGDEITGVLAHEFGHVLHDHVTRDLVRQIPALLMVGFLDGSNNGLAGLANTLVGRAFSRRFENEADQTAVQLLTAAHVASRPMADLFARMEEDEPGSGHSGRKKHGLFSFRLPGLTPYLSTHPVTAEREALFASAKVPNTSPVLTGEQFMALQSICGPRPKPPSTPEPVAKKMPDGL